MVRVWKTNALIRASELRPLCIQDPRPEIEASSEMLSMPGFPYVQSLEVCFLGGTRDRFVVQIVQRVLPAMVGRIVSC